MKAALAQIRLAASPAVRDAAEACYDTLYRYDTALTAVYPTDASPNPMTRQQADRVEATGDEWTAAVKQFHDAVRIERGEPVVSDVPTQPRHHGRGGDG